MCTWKAAQAYFTKTVLFFSAGHKEVSKICQEFTGGVNKKTITINYPVASILQQNPGNFYHWAAESVSRFMFLSEFLLTKKGKEKMKVLVPKMAENFVRQTLVDLLGFDQSRLMWYDRMDSNTRYLMKEVYLVDWHWTPRNNIQPTDLSGLYFPPRQAVKKLRATFAGYNDLDVAPANAPLKLLYLSREDATVRKLTAADERKISLALMDLVGPENFEWYFLKGLSVKQQIDLFHNVTIVVGPHGAGLTNLIWTRPGTSVVQFPMKPNNDNCFGSLASSLGIDYWLIPQINSFYYGVYPPVDDLGIRALVNVVKQILKEKGFEVGGKKKLKK